MISSTDQAGQQLAILEHFTYKANMILEHLPDVQKLSDEEKWTLIDELQESMLASEDESTKQAITAELEKRWAHYQAHPETAKTWEQVRAGLHAKK